MSFKNDSPNLTQKVEWSIQGLVVNLSILFLCFNSLEDQKRLSRQSVGFVLNAKDSPIKMKKNEVLNLFLIAALVFSAGYYSAPNFFLLRRKKCFALPILPLFQHFAWNLLTYLGYFLSSLILLKVIFNISCSAKQFKMNRVSIKKRNRNGINP